VDSYPHFPSTPTLQISLSLTQLGNPISGPSIVLQEGSRNSDFYEHVIILLVEQKDRLQGRALSGEAAVEKVTERCEGYERDVMELTACSREYQKIFTLTWMQLHNKLIMCRDDTPSWHSRGEG